MKKVKEIVLKACEKLGLEFYDIENARQGNDNIVRVMADTKEGITIDQVVALNKLLCEEIPEDLIAGEYMLEVSSPGAERKIRNLADANDSIGKYIFVKLYEKINDSKEYYGKLEAVNGDVITIAGLEIQFEKIATIRWAIELLGGKKK